MFKAVSNRQSFPELEKKVLQFWEENDSFRKSIEIRKMADEFVFYDGPPFATGLPHYGHILAGTIKDVIPRYQTMKGFRVERRFGWDCHGLPVENLIEKELGLGDKKAILAFGEDKFNEACRASVLRYTSEWEETVTRMGRWVDFKNSYKTMDSQFMESIWWVFKELWKKDMVYQGLKPMHVCPRCVTPLSNFEVNQGYKDLTDLSVTVKFKLKDVLTPKRLHGDEASHPLTPEISRGLTTYFLAWTTTPWTLPGNMLLAVNPKTEYVQIAVHPKQDFDIVEAKTQEEVSEAIDFILEHQYNRYNLQNTKEEILEEDEGYEIFYFMAKRNDAVIGVISAKIWPEHATHVAVHFWVVDEKERGKGVGKALMEKVDSIARERNESMIFAAARPGSEPMYEACGFTRKLSRDLIPYQGMMLVPHEKCVHQLEHSETFILAESLLTSHFPEGNYEIVKTFKGSELVGLAYEPLFPYYSHLQASADKPQPRLNPRDISGVKPMKQSGNIAQGVVTSVDDHESTDLHEVNPGLYFITFNTEGGVPFFEDETLRQMCAESFAEVVKKHKYNLYDLVIMPDHVHLVLRIEDGGESLPKTLQQLKWISSWKLKSLLTHGLTPEISRGLSSAVGRLNQESQLTIKKDRRTQQLYTKLWRQGYDKKYILNEDDYWLIHDYIQNNPVKKGLPQQHYDWLSSWDDEDTSGIKPLEVKEVQDEITWEKVKTMRYEKLLQPFGVPAQERDRFDSNDKRVVVAKVDGKIVGFLAWDKRKESIRLETLFIEPEFRHKGLGKSLLEFVEERVNESPRNRIFVEAEQSSIHFYEACGFKKYGEVSQNFGAIVQPMEKFIEQQRLTPEISRGLSFRVVAADFVTTDSGTGIVHIAPAFGEDDLQVGKRENLVAIQHVGMDGLLEKGLAESIKKIDPNFPVDLPVKDAKDNRRFDEKMVEFLGDKVFKKENIRHSYPTCWRCETPLLNYATKSWFVRVEQMRDQLSATNEQINWVPSHLKHGRFGKWLENARDWAVSRTRYWGTPLPVWQNDESGKQLCIGSIAELKELSGRDDITDLHKHFVDPITFTIKNEKGVYKRVEEVFDCWFESGAMPYAQRHFPFEETIIFKNDFYIARHGEAKHNVANVLSCTEKTAKEHGLTEVGKSQAETESQKSGMSFDYIIVSPFLRTQETSAIYQKNCGGELIIDERLKEWDVGTFDKQEFSVWKQWETSHNCWETAPGGGESLAHLTDRVADALHHYNNLYQGKKILFVTHGAPLQMALNYVKGAKPFKQDGEKIPKAKLFPLQNLKFPADFIAEGLDQTRGWFYTLHVLGTALFNKPAFSNVITNGIVLAEDGQKMSKSKKNYPDPSLIFEKYGADAMRFYLMSSPVVKADDLRFSEKGVEEVVRSVILPLWNAYSFFVTYANVDKWTSDQCDDFASFQPKNKLDRWILSSLQTLKKTVTEKLDNYDLQGVRDIVPFIDGLTNWYIRRSRRRFWKNESDADKNEAYKVLYHVLTELSKILAPICPFISESIYQNLTKKESVHCEDWPKVEKNRIDKKLEDEMALVQQIVSLGLQVRTQAQTKVRQPLQKIWISADSLNDEEKEVIKDELNVKAVEYKTPESMGKTIVKLNFPLAAPQLGDKVKMVTAALNGTCTKKDDGIEISLPNQEKMLLPFEWVLFRFEPNNPKDTVGIQNLVVQLDLTLTPELALEGQARDLVRMIQEMRKDADYQVSDRITLEVTGADEVLAKFGDYICEETLASLGVVEKADLEKEEEGVTVRIVKL